MPVRNIAVDAVTAQRDTPVQELVETMEEEEIGDVVIAEDGRPVGIVTDRDVALAVGEHGAVTDLEAEQVMTEDPATIHQDAEAVEVPTEMAESEVRRIPLVDDDGHLVGIATLDDIVATVGEELENVATVIESQSSGYSPE